MFKWGLPWFINILAGPSVPKATSVNPSEDVVPPQVPVLSPLIEATNSAVIKIEGYTEGRVEVGVILNDAQVTSTNSDDKGMFKAEFKLIEGSNKIQVKAVDSAGNSSQSVVKTVNFDKKGVEITVDSPKDGSEIFGQSKQDVTFSGKVSKPDASVTINGNYVRLDSNGNFSSIARLSQGDNNVSIKATDQAGNTVEKTVKIKLTF
jgi:bacillopeptidase F